MWPSKFFVKKDDYSFILFILILIALAPVAKARASKYGKVLLWGAVVAVTLIAAYFTHGTWLNT